MKCGDLGNALKSFSRARDFCVTAKHLVEMCLNVIEVSIAMGNFAHVQSYVLKAEATSDVPDKNVVAAKLKCATGLEQLDGGKFKRAARCFTEVAFELGNNYNEVRRRTTAGKPISVLDQNERCPFRVTRPTGDQR